MKKWLFLVELLVCGYCNAQWFDPQSIRNTVLIQKYENGAFQPHGTGFLFWNYKNPKHSIVVTCAHLLNRGQIYVIVNADSALYKESKFTDGDTLIIEKQYWTLEKGTLRGSIRLIKDSTFVVHNSLDIGAFLIDLVGYFKNDSGKVVQRVSDISLVSQSWLKLRQTVSLGDELYFVGFPFGLGTDGRLEPVIRSASVAWKSEKTKEFLLDAYSYGGNSGSPLFQKMILGRTAGEVSWEVPKLVGMVFGHLGSELKGALFQPDENNPKDIRRADVDLQNFGLARCFWIDDILDVIAKAQKLEIRQ